MPATQSQPGSTALRDRGLILLAAFVVVLPLLLRGASCGHDLDFHMTNWMEVAEQWRHAILWPRWAFTPAWGAGEPRFVFYPPLSWLLGGFLSLLMPVRFVPAAFSFVALTACGLSMRRLAAEWTAPNNALLAAVFFIANPYMLFCVYERCAFGELLAAAWMPLLLLAILQPAISLRSIAVPVALLWLTNAPSAVMSCYLFTLIALFRLAMIYRRAFSHRRIKTMLPFALRAAGGMILGIALAAFYIIPAAWERRWVRVDLVVLPPMDVASNTLFRHTFDSIHDTVLHTASCLVLILITLTVVFLIAAWKQHGRSHRSLVVLLGATALAIAFAQTRPSLFLWLHLPQLHFIQFPWRLLSLLGILCSLLLALATRHRGRILLAATVLLPIAAVPPAYRQFSSRCFDADIPNVQVADFHNGLGIDPTDEYTPLTADNDPLVDNVYPWWLTSDAHSLSQHPATQNGSIDFNLAQNIRVPATHPNFLVIRLRNYPAWQLRVNGNPAQLISRPDGFFAVALPSGESDVSLRYRTLPDDLLGIAISLIALIFFLLLRRRARHRGMNALSMPIRKPAPFLADPLPG